MEPTVYKYQQKKTHINQLPVWLAFFLKLLQTLQSTQKKNSWGQVIVEIFVDQMSSLLLNQHVQYTHWMQLTALTITNINCQLASSFLTERVTTWLMRNVPTLHFLCQLSNIDIWGTKHQYSNQTNKINKRNKPQCLVLKLSIGIINTFLPCSNIIHATRWRLRQFIPTTAIKLYNIPHRTYIYKNQVASWQYSHKCTNII